MKNLTLMGVAVCSLKIGIFTYCQKMLGVVPHIVLSVTVLCEVLHPGVPWAML